MSAANSSALHEDNRIDNWSYLWMGAFLVVGYILFSVVHYLFGALILKGLGVAVIAGLVFAMVYAVWKKTNSERRTVYLMLFISIVIRLCYLILTGQASHEGADYEIFTQVHTDMTLPEAFQPLYYVVAAAVYNFFGLFRFTQNYSLEVVRLITEYLGIVSAIATYYILCEIEANDTAVYFGTAMVAFHPGLILLGGEISPAMTTFTLLVMTMLFMSRWNNYTDGYNFLLMSITFGLAVMTELSALLFTPVVAALMAINLVRAVKRKSAVNIMSTAIQSAAGVVIWFLLSFAYPARNYWGSRDNGLLTLFKDVSANRGSLDFRTRFLSFSPEELFEVFAQPDDRNAWPYWVKTSLFGTRTVGYPDQLAPVFVAFAAIAAALMLGVALMVISNSFSRIDQKKKVNIWSFISLTVCAVGYYLLVNLGRPETASMDFKVVPILLVLGITMLGCGMKVLSIKKKLNFVAQILYFLIVLVTFAFCVLTVLYGILFA